MKGKKIIPVVIVSALLAFFIFTEFDFGKEEELKAAGTIEATEVAIRSEVGGTVEKVFVEEGQKVKKGTPLMQVDKTMLSFQEQQELAQLESLKEQLREMKAGARDEQIAQSKALIRQLEGQKEKSLVALEQAEKNYLRANQLYADGAVSEQEYERLKSQYLQAQKDMEIIDAQLQSARSQYNLLVEGATPESIAAMEAKVQAAEARVAAQQTSLQKTLVAAPVDGTVVNKLVEEGELVSPMNALINLANLQDLWITVYVPEKDLGKISLRQKVKIKVDAYPDQRFKGEIVRIADEAEFTPLNVQTEENNADLVFSVKIKVLEGIGKLRPGMPADVFFAEAK